jgi:hypothetical protein
VASSGSAIAHFVGYDLQSLSSPHFLTTVSDLFSRVQNEEFVPTYSGPVIVHCPGWYKAAGNTTVAAIIALSRATDIVCLSDPPPAILEKVKQMSPPPTLHQIPPSCIKVFQSPRSGDQLSDMGLISLFHRQLQNPQQLEPTPISSWRPLAVSIDGQARDFAGILIFGEFPKMYRNMLTKLLNGTIVSIVHVDDEYTLPDVMLGEGDNIPYFVPGPQGFSDLPDPSHSGAVGIGLIRSIDAEKRLFLVVGGLDTTEYRPDRLILVAGGFDVPNWAYNEDSEYEIYARRSGDPNAHSYISQELDESPWVETMQVGNLDD